MKSKLVLIVLILCLLLVACTGNDGNTSEALSEAESTVEESSAAPDESEVKEESKVDEVSKAPVVTFPEYKEPDFKLPQAPEPVSAEDVPEDECRVTVKYTTLCEKPDGAVVVGQCDMGATVTLQYGNEKFTSESWYGWYSVRFVCNQKSADIVITQTVDGKQVGAALETTVKPVYKNTDADVVAGLDYQFFYNKCLNDFQGRNLYSAGVLNNLKTRVQGRIENLKKVSPDTEIIYMVIPSSMTVYPELVPAQYKPAENTRLDQVNDTLREAGATVIDMRDVFAQHKDDEYPMFFKCDSHWSDYGAFLAYTELFNHIAKEFPDAAPRAFDEFSWHGGYNKTGDMPVYLNMVTGSVYENGKIGDKDVLEYGWRRTFKEGTQVSDKITKVPRYRADCQMVYTNDMTYEKTIRTNRENLPSCIVLRDSFSTQIYDILAERMDKTVFKGMWDYTYAAAQIAANKPDYVIYILAEWNLDSVVYN